MPSSLLERVVGAMEKYRIRNVCGVPEEQDNILERCRRVMLQGRGSLIGKGAPCVCVCVCVCVCDVSVLQSMGS